MKTKTFNIGEYAIGGRIKVSITGKVLRIEALDWKTREPVCVGTITTDVASWKDQVLLFLNKLTSYYYAEKIMNWITDKENGKPNLNRNRQLHQP